MHMSDLKKNPSTTMVIAAQICFSSLQPITFYKEEALLACCGSVHFGLPEENLGLLEAASGLPWCPVSTTSLAAPDFGCLKLWYFSGLPQLSNGQSLLSHHQIRILLDYIDLLIINDLPRMDNDRANRSKKFLLITRFNVFFSASSHSHIPSLKVYQMIGPS